MIRQAAAVVVALVLSTSPLYAQSTTVKLTVSEASATVHKSPSMASPVIGKAPHGTALVVTREVGDWVKVSWPSAVDGAGYVRMNAGTIARGDAAALAGAKAATTPASVGSTATPAPIAARTAQVPTSRPSAPSPASTLYVAPTHVFGIGAVAGGSTMGFGASARAWKQDRFGFQLEVSRHSFDSVDLLSRATSTDIAPSLLFALNDRVTDYLWLRPYVGVAGHLVHSSRTDLIFTDVTESANTFGVRGFAGAEMSFSSLPQLALSADVGYYHLPEPFIGFEPGGMGFSISAHWYVK
jgi:Bacterial SH3 domain